jgi:dTMP kinase
MYIVLEGIDTAGKSTQIEKLSQNFPNAIITKEPGGTDFGYTIRDMILNKGVASKETEMFLFLADRAEHYELIIKPNIDKMVISDRSLISGLAYAMSSDSFDIDFLISANKLALQNNLPNLIVILKLDEKTLKSRLGDKSHDKIEQRGTDYLLNIQENMLSISQRLGIDTLVIDASSDIDSIHRVIVEKIENYV